MSKSHITLVLINYVYHISRYMCSKNKQCVFEFFILLTVSNLLNRLKQRTAASSPVLYFYELEGALGEITVIETHSLFGKLPLISIFSVINICIVDVVLCLYTESTM